MAAGIDATQPIWVNPDVLCSLIDDLRDAGYRIGISQYLAVQDLMLALVAQGALPDRPEGLRTLLSPILCSSPTEQEDFQYRFECWLAQIKQSEILEPTDVKAKALSEELSKLQWRFRQLISILIALTLSGIFLPVLIDWLKADDPVSAPQPEPTAIASPPSVPPTQPPSDPEGLTPEVAPTPLEPSPVAPTPETTPDRASPLPTAAPTASSESQQDWRTEIAFSVLTLSIAFLVWRFWWRWRAHLFLQRRSTTQQPKLYRISVEGFEQVLFPNVTLIRIAQMLRRRIPVLSHELDVHKTIDATLKQGGWFTPVYGFRQIFPEYLFLIDRTSYRDHQAKLAEEVVDRLLHHGVFGTVYYFDGDPRICFPKDQIGLPLRLREIATKYSQSRLIVVADAETWFDPSTGELEAWVSQTATWSHRALLTPKPVETWGSLELALTQQFVVLPATLKGLQALGQVFYQGMAIFPWLEAHPIPLPDLLRVRTYRWIERDPPPSAQVAVMLKELRAYLGEAGFHWLSACAVFPELHWNLTLYLGSVLKTAEQRSFLDACSVAHLARLPWFRYGYMPDWLRDRLLQDLPRSQAQAVRKALQDLLITAVQGSVGKLQLEVAQRHHRFLPNLVNPMLRLLSRQAPEGSFLRDYTFLSFMTGQPKLAVQVPDRWAQLVRGRRPQLGWRTVGTTLAATLVVSFGIYAYLRLSVPPSNPPENGLDSTPTSTLPIPNNSAGLRHIMQATAGQWEVARAVAMSPDGSIIASGDDDGEIQLWNLDGELMQTLAGHSGNVQAVAFSPDGQSIASGGADGTLRIWGLDGSLISEISGLGGVYSLAFSPDGQLLLSGQQGGVIAGYMANGNGKNLISLPLFSLPAHSGNVTAIAMEPDGTGFASNSFESVGAQGDDEVKLWDLATRQLSRTFNAGGSGGVNSIAISPDGQVLAGYSSLEGENVRLWNLQTGAVIGTLETGINRPHALAFSPDGRTLAVGGFADQIQLWDWSTQTQRDTLSSDIPDAHTYSLAFSPDGRTLVSVGSNGQEGVVMIWDILGNDSSGSQETSSGSRGLRI